MDSPTAFSTDSTVDVSTSCNPPKTLSLQVCATICEISCISISLCPLPCFLALIHTFLSNRHLFAHLHAPVPVFD